MPTLFRRIVVIALVLLATPARGQLPTRISDKQFWELFTSMSEEGGSFPSENFISNEQTFQYPIPSLQKTVRAGDVYLGVGPEQNFTYIANLKPRLAIIFDIRRQNAMAHLMYKALFELAPTRADFLSRLFSRPMPAGLKAAATAEQLFAAMEAAAQNDSLFEENQQAIFAQLTKTHGFALDSTDFKSIRHVYVTFFEAGPDINYGYRPGIRPMFSTYPTLGQIQTLKNTSGENMAFLADEARYQAVRAMHLGNLIVPVVGDFAGPKAIRAVGAWLKERKANVGAFYLSNVEQYLFRAQRDADAFYENVSALPTDTTSMFIRSVPPQSPTIGFGSSGTTFVGAPLYSVTVNDSAGVSTIVVTTDSGGKRTTTRTLDSSATRPRSPVQVFRALQPARTAFSAQVLMNTLISGTSPISAGLSSFRAGALKSYFDVIALTKTDGW